MKRIYKLLIITIIALGFSACDDEDGGSNASFSIEETSSNNTTIMGCNDTTDIPDGYTTLNSGDTIVKSTDGTEISVYHNSDGTKKICVEAGSAYIIQG